MNARRWTNAALAVAFALSVAACGNVTKTLSSIEPIREDVRKELGVDASVNVRSMNGKTSVSVSLLSLPDGPPAKVKEKVLNIVKQRLPNVEEVVVLAKL